MFVTAAGSGEVDMAQALIAAGADLEATGVAIPGGTALTHAVEFGNTEVVDVPAAAGGLVEISHRGVPVATHAVRHPP